MERPTGTDPSQLVGRGASLISEKRGKLTLLPLESNLLSHPVGAL
jgi:hypothetical protein